MIMMQTGTVIISVFRLQSYTQKTNFAQIFLVFYYTE